MRASIAWGALVCILVGSAACRSRASCEDMRPAVIDFIRSESAHSKGTVYLQCGAVRWVLEAGDARASTKEAVEPECEAHGCSRWVLTAQQKGFQLCATESPPLGHMFINARTCWEFAAERRGGQWRIVNMEISERS